MEAIAGEMLLGKSPIWNSLGIYSYHIIPDVANLIKGIRSILKTVS